MIVECEACGIHVDHDPGSGYLPHGWKLCRIEALTVRLCEACGASHNFVGGLSPHLQMLLTKKGYELESAD